MVSGLQSVDAEVKIMKEEVRRADLYLRAEYPHFETKLFRISSGRFQIFVGNYSENFDSLKDKFDKSIKPITLPATLVNELPTEYAEEIAPIKDNEIAATFAGIPFNTRDLKHILVIKFPSIDICHVEGNSGDNKVKVYTKSIKDTRHRENLLDFLKKIETGVPFVLIDDDEQTDAILQVEQKRQERMRQNENLNSNLARLNQSFNNPVLHVFPSKLNRHKVDFDRRDETFWFDHINEIFEGKITGKDILGDKTPENTCYLDYAGFKNVNIRNGLVLFDKVYIELPVDRGMDYFFEDQKITRDELLLLCKEGKVTLTLTQPYFRYDFNFLNEVFRTNPSAILSRRALSSLILCDLVSINKNYLLNSLDAFDTLHEISRIFSEACQLDFQYVYDLFTWPKKALRRSFECLLLGSTKTVSSFGINNVFDHFTEKDQSKALEFEFSVNSEKVHISSALNSFYFPVFNDEAYSNRVYTSLMGNMLNLYKNSTRERLTSYVSLHERQSRSNPMVSPLDLIEVNEFFSVSEIHAISKHFYSGSNFQSIISYLSSLPQVDRDKKVAE